MRGRYSQNNEEEFILDWFQDKTDGFFLDIGAGDGVNDSNTRALWERGWSGMCIEPNWRAFRQLMEVYGPGMRVVRVHAAITTENGPVLFYEHPITGWSSLTPHLGDQKDYRASLVQGLTIDSLKIPWKVDFISIDTEGWDAAILSTLPPYIRPKLILAEQDKAVRGEWDVGSILVKWGYHEVWHNEANVAYALQAGS